MDRCGQRRHPRQWSGSPTPRSTSVPPTPSPYLKAITPLTEQTGDNVYHQMATPRRACHEALGTPEKFRQYLTVLRTSQKRKRNLMKILADNGL